MIIGEHLIVVSQKYRIPQHAWTTYCIEGFLECMLFKSWSFLYQTFLYLNLTNAIPLLSLEALWRASQLSSMLYKLLMLALIWQNPGLFCCWDVKALFILKSSYNVNILKNYQSMACRHVEREQHHKFFTNIFLFLTFSWHLMSGLLKLLIKNWCFYSFLLHWLGLPWDLTFLKKQLLIKCLKTV